MPDGTSLINLGDLSKPATVLIEKISEAVGGVFRPYQIKRVAQAEADAEVISAEASIKVTDLQRRAMHRFLIEEGQKQQNIESITEKALPTVAETARPQDVEKDWITNFFDKSRLVSDDKMQGLWSKVLAGEANSPGSFNKRTVNLLGSLDKDEAELFQSLASFIWEKPLPQPFIYEVLDEIYARKNITFFNLTKLDKIGVLNFSLTDGYSMRNQEKRIEVSYFGRQFSVEFEQDAHNLFGIGTVMLTEAGRQLATIAGAKPVEGLEDYIVAKWEGLGYKVTPL